jgi:hypothetical protein
MSILSVLLAATTPFLQTAPASPPAAAGPGTIIVTGRRIQDFRAALEACLARHCPPNEDIDATTALAEALYLDGQYHEARTALLRSLSRNRREARNYPEPVSDLYRANARVARALGLDRDAESSTREILRSLQAGIPVEDYRHLTARFEIVQQMTAFGQYPQAGRMLRDIAMRAASAGRDDVVAMAELRLLWLDHLQGPRGGPPSSRLLAMARSPDPHRSIGARILLVRIYAEKGETAAADRLIAELGRSSGRRQLLFNPPYELLQSEDVAGRRDRVQAILQGETITSNIADRVLENFDDKWIDVGFWIRPDGRVEDLEIVRRRNRTDWAEPLLQSIRGRRYAASDGTSTYRVERYTYTSGYDDQGTATRTATRSPRARIEYFDLSGLTTPPAARPES